MLRLALFLITIAVAAAGLAWLADRPGELLINWQGHEIKTTVFHAIVIMAMVVGLSILLWSIARGVWQSPAAIGSFFNRRREKRGLEALSSGMIAIGAGDKALATRYAIQARKSLPNEPMTHLLRAQAARLSGDQATTRRIFEAMLSSPDTEQLGLRGLFLEAEQEGEQEAARQFAERALKLNPKLAWPVDALLGIQCRQQNWAAALQTLGVARKNGHIEREAADRKRAVLLTVQAQHLEDNDPERAMNLALEAHNLAPDLVPAAAIAGRVLAARGSTPKAIKVIQKTWKKSPHPDLAVAYAYARIGDSPRDRLDRVGKLAAMTPNVIESPIALANAAIEARDFDAARKALASLTEDNRLTQRVCTLMARIEGETGNSGGVREWLARAVNAPRDPAWTADGFVSEEWAAVSPVTGALDAFRWRVPVEAAQPGSKELLAEKIEELVKLGARTETVIEAAPRAGAGEGDDREAGDRRWAAAAAPGAPAEPKRVDAVPARSTPVAPAAAAVAAATVEATPVSISEAPPSPSAAAGPGRSAQRTTVQMSEAVDAEVVEVVKVVSTERAAPVQTKTAEAEPVMKVVDIPADSTAADRAKTLVSATGAGKAGNGNGHRPSTKVAEPAVEITRPAAQGGKDKDAKPRPPPLEPKIFVSPRAPDDPGPVAEPKK